MPVSEDEYRQRCVINDKDESQPTRLFIGTPTRGLVRMEWVQQRFGQIIPCNWSCAVYSQYIQGHSTIGYRVADAQNIIVKQALEGDYEWLLLIEDDTIPPSDAFIRINEYMNDGSIPVVSGLYFTKADPSEPLVYRGRGNSYYGDFDIGDLVWADGIPTGFFLCNMKVLKLMWDESPEYMAGNVLTRRVFDQPEFVWADPETHNLSFNSGTSDLFWCKRVIQEDVLGRAGWKKIGKKKYPFLVDTNLFCQHITPDGKMYPQMEILEKFKK